MNKKLSDHIKKIKSRFSKWSTYLYDKAETVKETIDFTIKSSLYLYGISWGLLLGWLILTKRIQKDEIIMSLEQILTYSEILLPFSTFAALLLVFTVITPLYPNIIKTKPGRTVLFTFILGFFLYTFLAAAKTLI